MSTIFVADIMSSHLITLSSDATLEDAHNLTRQKGIRHIPVLDKDTGKLCAVISQKRLISKVVSLITLYGKDALEHRENRTPIMEVAETEYDTVAATLPVKEVARYFVQNKHGCLPVVDESEELVGIITSSDFVSLCAQLLENQEKKVEL